MAKNPTKRKAFRSPGIDGERLLAEARVKVRKQRKGKRIDRRWLPLAMTQKEVDAESERRARKNLRLVPIADVKELHWWRQHFATRFRPGSLPKPGTSLVARRLELFEVAQDRGYVSLDDKVRLRGDSDVIAQVNDALISARADSQRSLRLAGHLSRCPDCRRPASAASIVQRDGGPGPCLNACHAEAFAAIQRGTQGATLREVIHSAIACDGVGIETDSSAPIRPHRHECDALMAALVERWPFLASGA